MGQGPCARFTSLFRVSLILCHSGLGLGNTKAPFTSFLLRHSSLSQTKAVDPPPTLGYQAPLPSSSPHSCSVNDGKKGNEFLDILGFFLISVFACHYSSIIDSDFMYYCCFCERKKGKGFIP